MSKSKEAKPIVIQDENGNPEYTLTFTRETVKWAEERGFDISEVVKFPLTGITTLFYFAFRANHNWISRKETERIYEELKVDKKALLLRMIELYNASIESLMDDTSESEKNGTRMVEL